MAQTYLGIMYCQGRGAIKNYARGVAYLQKSADAGDPVADFQLAVLFDDITPDFMTDYDDALRYYLSANKKGLDWDVLFNNIALIYEKKKKLGKAEAYFKKALAHIEKDDLQFKAFLEQRLEQIKKEKK